MGERERVLFQAQLAEQAERYDEMAEHMKAVCVMRPALSAAERNLLSVSFKNVVGALRQAWRATLREEEQQGERWLPVARDYRRRLEQSLRALCAEVLALVDEHLLPKAEDAEARVYLYKLRGDYLRYLAEVQSDDERTGTCAQARDAYEQATQLAAELPATDPMRLGVALNYSVLFYEVSDDTARASDIARAAFDEAIAGLDDLPEASFKDSTLLMQLLRDNLTLWAADEEEEEG